MQIRYRTELPELMRQLKLPMVAVECGCAEGLFSADLLRLGIEKLYMVDVWETINGQKGDGGSPNSWHYANYQQAIERVIHNPGASILRGLSKEMAEYVPDDSLGLVYLDADHSYEGVMKDLNAWFPKLIKGGIMAGHDYLQTEYGIKDAVAIFTAEHSTEVSHVHIIWEDKKEDAGFWFQKL